MPLYSKIYKQIIPFETTYFFRNAKYLSEKLIIKYEKTLYTDKKKAVCELSKKTNDEGGVAKAVKLIQEAMN